MVRRRITLDNGPLDQNGIKKINNPLGYTPLKCPPRRTLELPK